MGYIVGDLVKWSLLYSIPFLGECCCGRRKDKALWNNLFEKNCAFPNDPAAIKLAARSIRTHHLARVIGNIVKTIEVIALAIFTSPFVLLIALKFVYQAGSVIASMPSVNEKLAAYHATEKLFTSQEDAKYTLEERKRLEALTERKEKSERINWNI